VDLHVSWLCFDAVETASMKQNTGACYSRRLELALARRWVGRIVFKCVRGCQDIYPPNDRDCLDFKMLLMVVGPEWRANCAAHLSAAFIVAVATGAPIKISSR